MKHLNILCLLLAITAPFGVAVDSGAGGPDNPVTNFEYLWNTLDRTYAQFEVKRVDWEALYKVYRPRVRPEMSEPELWSLMLDMMSHLNDAHVCLSDGARRECVGIVDELPRDDFSLELVKTRYLSSKADTALGGSFTYGWLSGKIGYLHIGDFKDPLEETVRAIDGVMEELADADGMIVDVRFNPGGTGWVANLVANRFADRKRHYMTSQVRYGGDHHDLGPVRYWYVEPEAPVRFTGSTILLTHRFTESAADVFTLAMRVLPHVTVVGDFTAGAFSSQFPERLPNGWTLWVAFKLLRDHEGVCWDGIGVPPDLRVKGTKADIDAGNDHVLEFAIELLERGGLKRQDEAASLQNLKISLVEGFAADVEAVGLEAALASLNRARTSGDDHYFFTADEIMQLGRRYQQAGKVDELIAILEVCREEFPHLASTYSMLARAYLDVGNIEAAEDAIEAGEQVEAMLPWEAGQLESAKKALRKAIRGSAAAIVEDALAEGGIEEAQRVFEEALARGDSGPVFDERDFNRLGYRLMQSGDLEKAIFVFNKNVELHPDSWNVYDSLGEAFMNAGNEQLAIENYRKSLELNPGNKGARTILDELEQDE